MSDVAFQWSISGGRQEGEAIHLRPGESLGGTLGVTSAEGMRSRGIILRLQWRTEGRGDTDRGVAEELRLYEGPLEAGVPLSLPFRFTVPESPWSFAGHCVSIVWELEAVVGLPMALDPRSVKRMVVFPD
jgi:hypothetical protein